MTPEEIREVLEKHKRWLEESEGWSEDDRADLSRADLSGADLSSKQFAARRTSHAGGVHHLP